MSDKEKLLEKRVRELEKWRDMTLRIIQDIKDCLPVLPEMEIKPIEEEKRFDPEEAILLFSDAQIGQEVKKEETGGLSEYNIEVFKKQIYFLQKKIKKIVSMQRKSHRVDYLNIFILGDLVENELMFQHQYYVEIDVYSQWLLATQEIAKMIIRLSSEFKKVRIFCVPGNHGRISREKEFLINWDMITYNFLKEMTKNQKNLEWHITKSWWQIAEVEGWRFLLIHGEDIRMWMGIPFYGLDRTDKRYTQLLEKFNKNYDYFVCGHFHIPVQIDTSKGEMIINGTFVGTNIWAMKKLNLIGRPTQLLLFCHKKVGLTARYPIRLDKV